MLTKANLKPQALSWCNALERWQSRIIESFHRKKLHNKSPPPEDNTKKSGRSRIAENFMVKNWNKYHIQINSCDEFPSMRSARNVLCVGLGSKTIKELCRAEGIRVVWKNRLKAHTFEGFSGCCWRCCVGVGWVQGCPGVKDGSQALNLGDRLMAVLKWKRRVRVDDCRE